MNRLFHALRLLLALCIVLPAAPASPSPAACEREVVGSVAGPLCTGLPGESRLDERGTEARPDERFDGATGSGHGFGLAPAPSAAIARRVLGVTLAPLDEDAWGAALAARAFLRVNGSANANGAKARRA